MHTFIQFEIRFLQCLARRMTSANENKLSCSWTPSKQCDIIIIISHLFCHNSWKSNCKHMARAKGHCCIHFLAKAISLWSASLLVFTTSGIACLVNVYYTEYPVPFNQSLTNRFVSLWACFLTWFVALQSLILQYPPTWSQNQVL